MAWLGVLPEEQMRQVIAALGRLTEESVPEQARADLLRTFRHWKSPDG